LSNLVLGAAVYYAVEQSVSSQLEGRIEREMALLRTDFRFNGLQWLINEVQQRAFSPGSFDYRLESRSGQLLAGNLPATTLRSEDQSEGWAKFADLAFLQRGDDALVSERILVTKLDPNIRNVR
jgi:hypothetical protein